MRYGDYLMERLDKNYAYRQQPAGMSALEVTSLAFAYDGALAVRDVSISVQPGEIVALLGANGAGKSTTVRMIAGVLSPQKGAIRFGGETLDRIAQPSCRAPRHHAGAGGPAGLPADDGDGEPAARRAHQAAQARSPRWSSRPSPCSRGSPSGAASSPAR